MISSMLIKAREKVSTDTFDGLTVVSSQALDYSISNCVVKLLFLYFDIGYLIKELLLQIIKIRNKSIFGITQSLDILPGIINLTISHM